MTAILERIWPDVQAAIRKADSQPDGSFAVFVGLNEKNRNENRIWIQGDGLVRLSSGDSSVEQQISRQDFLDFARDAIEHPSQLIRINKQGMKELKYAKPGRLGSFVCTCLGMLPYFEYRPGQYLIFLPDRA